MTGDDELPRRRGGAVAAMGGEDLDPYSVAELEERIAALRREIDRTEAKLAFARAHKSSADSLFR